MPKILIADDNNNIQKMVSLAFEERGIQVISVGNGEAAVRRLADLNPDIVLADIFMPVRSGYEVCEYIKKDPRFSHIPVILLVGAFDPLDEKEARRVGADGVLKKPFVPPDPLIAMVTSVLLKNPRIAAELAKAKEVAAEPPPLPEPQVVAQIEVKPLPEFPEPTAEEAAMLYGFGNGRRSTFDDVEIEAAQPVAADLQEGSEVEEDAPDWRRAAMEFEVPEEAGGRPAFSDETIFPSHPGVAIQQARSADSEEKPETAFEPVAALGPVIDEVAAQPFAAMEHEIPVLVTDPAEQGAIAPDFAPEVPHWMDALSSEPGRGGWMAGLATKQEEVQEVVPEQSMEPQEVAGSLGLPEQPLMLAARAPELRVETAEQSPAAIAQVFGQRDSFFAPEPVADSAGDSANGSWFAPAPAAFAVSRESKPRPDTEALRKDLDLVEPPAVRVVPEPLLDTEETDIPASVSMRDPYLIEAPAVHVNPEPLLDAEEPQLPTQVHSHAEEIAPAYTLLGPESAPSIAEQIDSRNQSQGDFHGEPHSESTGSSAEVWANEFSERIPTGPPPNRDALAEIPFLTPPANFHPDSPEETKVSDETMDAVVQRVLEKLEPRLHELLSQGVLKPLVEDLLHGEFAARKNR